MPKGAHRFMTWQVLRNVRVPLFMLGALTALSFGCEKVPLVGIDPSVVMADAVWFEDEQTLFFFYHVEAQQPLEAVSLIEVTYRTDAEAIPWTPLLQLPAVHSHLAVDCSNRARCGSWSVKVVQEPRDIRLRLRYHPTGGLAFEMPTAPYVVNSGPPHLSRSLVVYGVFDEQNLHVQWRGRHQFSVFPNARYRRADELGLRRNFEVTNAKSGSVTVAAPDNLYWYAGTPCEGTELGWAPRNTTERAIFSTEELPVTMAADSTVCAWSTVYDATGPFTAVAVARKNPEVRSAFPFLQSPVRPALPLRYVLRPCARTVSDQHEQMQEQRTLAELGSKTLCTDDWHNPSFADALASTFRQDVDLARTSGQDMVLELAFHHDDESGALASSVADALAQVLIPERDKSSPRAAGAFVFDSYGRTLPRSELKPLALWCPATVKFPNLHDIPSAAQLACAIMPDTPDLMLGPFKFNTLPILPSREQYLNFVQKYGEAQAGKVTEQEFWVPLHSPITDNVPLEDFGVATFLGNEVMTPALSDAFSVCAPTTMNSYFPVVFRSSQVPSPAPLAVLPQFHRTMPATRYDLGLAWDSPFRLRMRYETALAGSATAFGFSVPFGIRNQGERDYGSTLWQQMEFDLRDVLKQCTRFCTHPTFHTDGVYHVQRPFSPDFETQCYPWPLFPKLGDGGFPLDD